MKEKELYEQGRCKVKVCEYACVVCSRDIQGN